MSLPAMRSFQHSRLVTSYTTPRLVSRLVSIATNRHTVYTSSLMDSSVTTTATTMAAVATTAPSANTPPANAPPVNTPPANTTTSTNANTLAAPHAIDSVIVLYPFLAGLAAHLDRTDLHSLASTCHSVHAALSDYRPTLLARSLRCAFPLRQRLRNMSGNANASADTNANTDSGAAASASTGAGTSILGGARRQLRHSGGDDGRRCARDLVRACLRCGEPTCRVCLPPSQPAA